MGLFSNLSEAGASALSAGVGFLGNLGGSIAGSLFNANQSKINRKFQERMYDKQVQDNINFWKMQAEYDNPSAALQRIQDAGLNPLLYYSDGSGVSGNLAQPPQSATAPHGSQASGNINSQIDLANLALLKAQVSNINADTEDKEAAANQKRNQTVGIVLQNEIVERTKEAAVALAHKNVDRASQEIEWLATQDFALTNMTAASIDNLASIIEYRKKYYDIDNQRMLNDFWYQVESIALGKAHVSNELKQISVNWYNARTNRKRVDGELEVFEAQVKEINSRKDLTDQEKSNKILDAYNTMLKNTMLENIGTENLGGPAGLLLLLTGKVFGRIED